MTNELENYLNETSMNAAKLRTSQRHIDGWRPINSSKNQNGTWTITWNNDPPAPPIPPRSLTQRQFIDELALQNNVIII